MKYIETNWDIPFYNMAFEEYVINHMPEDDYVFFYIHKPSIIVGKHQNTIEEINKDYVDRNQIHVARRLSGGGAVYHDSGNLNFSFIVQAEAKDVNNFKKFTLPVIKALEKMGVQSELTGRNDITIDGKKFSGNAQYFRRKKLLHHGTMLFNSQMSNLADALQVKELKIKSKGIKSVRSRVTNIIDHLEDKKLSILDFKKYLLECMSQENNIEKYILTESDKAAVKASVDKKFGTWEWNWGESPAFELQKIDKFDCGIIDARMNIKEGIIKDIKIFGDFFVRKEIEVLEDQLRYCQYRKEMIAEKLLKMNIEDFFHGLKKEQFIHLLCEQ
ncbi:MAG: lipoate--protein ligase [Eubacteriales bacterium]